MLEREGRSSEGENSDLEPPQWMFEPGIFSLSEDEVFMHIKSMIRSSELRALRKTLWILLKHRFHSIPHELENRIAVMRESHLLLAAFKQALTIEDIEKFHFYIKDITFRHYLRNL